MVHFLKSFTDPGGLLWLGLVAWSVWRLARRQWRRALAPAILALILSLVGGCQLPARWAARLERPFTGVDLAKLPAADAVVMLGGVLSPSRNEVLGANYIETVDRVITAAELVRQGKARALVLGGGGLRPGETGPIESELVERWLRAWGLTNAPFLRLGACVDTHDEALRTQALAQQQHWQRLIVVSSAGHLRRAEGVFRRLGLPVTCVGCDFNGTALLERRHGFTPFAQWDDLRLLSACLHESIGWWYYRCRGWL